MNCKSAFSDEGFSPFQPLTTLGSSTCYTLKLVSSRQKNHNIGATFNTDYSKKILNEASIERFDKRDPKIADFPVGTIYWVGNSGTVSGNHR